MPRQRGQRLAKGLPTKTAAMKLQTSLQEDEFVEPLLHTPAAGQAWGQNNGLSLPHTSSFILPFMLSSPLQRLLVVCAVPLFLCLSVRSLGFAVLVLLLFLLCSVVWLLHSWARHGEIRGRVRAVVLSLVRRCTSVLGPVTGMRALLRNRYYALSAAIRDGKVVTIPSCLLVAGDVLLAPRTFDRLSLAHLTKSRHPEPTLVTAARTLLQTAPLQLPPLELVPPQMLSELGSSSDSSSDEDDDGLGEASTVPQDVPAGNRALLEYRDDGSSSSSDDEPQPKDDNGNINVINSKRRASSDSQGGKSNAAGSSGRGAAGDDNADGQPRSLTSALDPPLPHEKMEYFVFVILALAAASLGVFVLIVRAIEMAAWSSLDELRSDIFEVALCVVGFLPVATVIVSRLAGTWFNARLACYAKLASKNAGKVLEERLYEDELRSRLDGDPAKIWRHLRGAFLLPSDECAENQTQQQQHQQLHQTVEVGSMCFSHNLVQALSSATVIASLDSDSVLTESTAVPLRVAFPVLTEAAAAAVAASSSGGAGGGACGGCGELFSASLGGVSLGEGHSSYSRSGTTDEHHLAAGGGPQQQQQQPSGGRRKNKRRRGGGNNVRLKHLELYGGEGRGKNKCGNVSIVAFLDQEEMRASSSNVYPLALCALLHSVHSTQLAQRNSLRHHHGIALVQALDQTIVWARSMHWLARASHFDDRIACRYRLLRRIVSVKRRGGQVLQHKCALVFEMAGAADLHVYTIGSFDAVLGSCTTSWEGSNMAPMSLKDVENARRLHWPRRITAVAASHKLLPARYRKWLEPKSGTDFAEDFVVDSELVFSTSPPRHAAGAGGLHAARIPRSRTPEPRSSDEGDCSILSLIRRSAAAAEVAASLPAVQQIRSAAGSPPLSPSALRKHHHPSAGFSPALSASLGGTPVLTSLTPLTPASTASTSIRQQHQHHQQQQQQPPFSGTVPLIILTPVAMAHGGGGGASGSASSGTAPADSGMVPPSSNVASITSTETLSGVLDDTGDAMARPDEHQHDEIQEEEEERRVADEQQFYYATIQQHRRSASYSRSTSGFSGFGDTVATSSVTSAPAVSTAIAPSAASSRKAAAAQHQHQQQQQQQQNQQTKSSGGVQKPQQQQQQQQVVAAGVMPSSPEAVISSVLDEHTLLGLVGLDTLVHPEVDSCIQALNDAGVRVVHFSESTLREAKSYAAQVGLSVAEINSCVSLSESAQRRGLGFEYKRAQLPRGIHEIRNHLRFFDTIPLHVPLFCDATPSAVRDMISIMQDNHEVVCAFGAPRTANLRPIIQASLAVCVAPDPSEDMSLCRDDVLNRVAPEEPLAAVSPHGQRCYDQIDLLCNSVATVPGIRARFGLPTLTMLLREARISAARLAGAAEFSIQASCAVALFRCSTLVAGFRQGLDATATLFALYIVIPLLAGGVLLARDGGSVAGSLKKMPSKHNFTQRLEMLRVWCLWFIMRYGPTIAVLYAVHLVDYFDDEGEGRLTARQNDVYSYNINSSNSSRNHNVTGAVALSDLQQQQLLLRSSHAVALVVCTIFLSLHALCHVSAYSTLSVFPAAGRTSVLQCRGLLCCGAVAVALSILAFHSSGVRFGPFAITATCVYAPLIVIIDHFVKRTRLNRMQQRQKYLKLVFATRLGMHSPVGQLEDIAPEVTENRPCASNLGPWASRLFWLTCLDAHGDGETECECCARPLKEKE